MLYEQSVTRKTQKIASDSTHNSLNEFQLANFRDKIEGPQIQAVRCKSPILPAAIKLKLKQTELNNQQ